LCKYLAESHIPDGMQLKSVEFGANSFFKCLQVILSLDNERNLREELAEYFQKTCEGDRSHFLDYLLEEELIRSGVINQSTCHTSFRDLFQKLLMNDDAPLPPTALRLAADLFKVNLHVEHFTSDGRTYRAYRGGNQSKIELFEIENQFFYLVWKKNANGKSLVPNEFH